MEYNNHKQPMIRIRLLFWLRRSKLNKRGEVPIMARLTVSGRRKELSTGIMTKPADFDSQKQRLKDHVKDAVLNKFRQNVDRAFLALLDQKRQITVENLSQMISVKEIGHLSLITHLNLVIKDKAPKLTESSKKSYLYKVTSVERLLSGLGKKGLLPGDLDFKTLNQVIDAMKAQGYKPGYSQKLLSFIREGVKRSIREGELQFDPTAGYSAPADTDKDPVHFTRSEVDLLFSFPLAGKTMNQIRDLFIFQCFTGMAYSDVMAFSPDWIRKETGKREYIYYRRQKKGALAILPLLNEARIVLEKYPERLPRYSNQKYNEYLKVMAALLDIDKRVTTHTGRKTFGHLMLNEYGFSLENVARMMGHSKISTTTKYYTRVTEERIEREASLKVA